MDRLKSMQVFAKVVEQGGFAKAASALDMSGAVVTRHVFDLERHLGTRLLNRTTRRLSLTEAGHAYLERVRPILLEIEDAEAVASSQAKMPSGVLRIYSELAFGQTQLAGLLPSYAARYPDIVFDITLSDRALDLVDDGFDLGIFIGGIQKFDGSMIARQLGVTEALLCASPRYVRQHGAPRTPEDVARHVCLNFSFEQLRHAWPIGSGQTPVNIPITSKMYSNSFDILRQCATADMGLIIGTSFALNAEIASGRLVRLLPSYRLGALRVMLVYPSRRLLSGKVRSFVDFMIGLFPRPETDPWLECDRIELVRPRAA